MMKIKILLVATCLSNFAFGQNSMAPGEFRLTGKISGQKTGQLILNYENKDDQNIIDTAFVLAGRFSFKGYIKEPTLAFLIGDVLSRSVDDPNFTVFFLQDTLMEISLVCNQFKHANISGSFTQNELKELENDDAYIQREKLVLEFNDNRSALEKDREDKILKAKDDSIMKAFDPYNKKIKEIELNFIATHGHSFLSPYKLLYLLSQIPIDSVEKLYNGFDAVVQRSRSGNLIADLLGGQPGHKAALFAVPDINGDLVSLSSFKGRNYVLLDFWASWCVPCRQNNPGLIEIYNRYHPKGLEIIGIAHDDTRKEAWKKAIAADHIEIWRQVLQNAGTQNDLGKKFGVTPIPLKILIDKNGMIIGRYNSGDDDLLSNKLKEIFQ